MQLYSCYDGMRVRCNLFLFESYHHFDFVIYYSLLYKLDCLSLNVDLSKYLRMVRGRRVPLTPEICATRAYFQCNPWICLLPPQTSTRILCTWVTKRFIFLSSTHLSGIGPTCILLPSFSIRSSSISCHLSTHSFLIHVIFYSSISHPHSFIHIIGDIGDYSDFFHTFLFLLQITSFLKATKCYITFVKL